MFVGGHQTDDLSRPGNYGGVQLDMTAIGQDEFVEDDSSLWEGVKSAFRALRVLLLPEIGSIAEIRPFAAVPTGMTRRSKT